MEFFRIHRTIPFMRYALVFNVISLVTFLTAVGFLAFRGLNLSIEFTGGTVMEVAFRAPANLEGIRSAIAGTEKGEFQVQSFGSADDVLIRLPARTGFTSGQQAEQVFAALTAAPSAGEAPACTELRRVEYVGPQVGSELAQDGGVALLMVVLGIALYLAIRFEKKFSAAAI